MTSQSSADHAANRVRILCRQAIQSETEAQYAFITQDDVSRESQTKPGSAAPLGGIRSVKLQTVATNLDAPIWDGLYTYSGFENTLRSAEKLVAKAPRSAIFWMRCICTRLIAFLHVSHSPHHLFPWRSASRSAPHNSGHSTNRSCTH